MNIRLVCFPIVQSRQSAVGQPLSKIERSVLRRERPRFHGGGIEGGVEAAGRQLLACAVRAGFGTDSRVHAVGDGAPWIVGQIEETVRRAGQLFD